MQSIVAEILAGNPDAFRLIVQEYRDDLLRIAWHYFHDWEEAKDITQDTFIRCYRSLHHYDPGQPFKPWLYQIHTNCCRSASRRWWKHLWREQRLEQIDAEYISTASVDDDNEIRQAVDKLSRHQKEAFVMLAIEGLSTSETALALGIAESTVRVHYSRAREKLRKVLKENVDDQ